MLICDAAPGALDHFVLAHLVTPPAIVAAAPDWIGGDRRLIDTFNRYVRSPADAKQFYQYRSEGPLGIPALTIDLPVDHRPPMQVDGKTFSFPQTVGLASTACLFLDLELYQRAGGWGPQCKITEILEMPSGPLVKDERPGRRDGDYLYSPRGEGVESVRFVLENGAGKKVDVTVKLNARN